MGSLPFVSSDLSQIVAQSADAAELHAPVPTLLLELQTLLGTLTATVAAETNRGAARSVPARSGVPGSVSSPTASTCWPTRPASTSPAP